MNKPFKVYQIMKYNGELLKAIPDDKFREMAGEVAHDIVKHGGEYEGALCVYRKKLSSRSNLVSDKC